MDKPLVSVLMTAYNRGKYIAEAIESVIHSTYQNWELIIVDDCSKDNTVAIARAYESKDNRIRVYINEKNIGDYPNRNRAASYAKGKYLKYLDSDDIFYPYGLDVMVAGMERHNEAALGILASQNKAYQVPYPFVLSPIEVYRAYYLQRISFIEPGPSGTIIRRKYFEEVNGFSGKRFIGDKEMWLKLTQKWPLVCLAPDLIWWRQHDSQEFDIGIKSNQYTQLGHQVNIQFLQDPQCPLNQAEIKSVYSILRKKYFLTSLSLTRRLNWKNAKVYFLLLLSILPWKKLN